VTISSWFARYILISFLWIHGWLLKLHIVGWPREWCYYRLHEDITIWRHGFSKTWFIWPHNDDEFLSYDDRLILTYVDYHGWCLLDMGYSLVMIHGWYIEGPCRKIMQFLVMIWKIIMWWLWCFHIWYGVNDFVLLLGDMTYAELIHGRLW